MVHKVYEEIKQQLKNHGKYYLLFLIFIGCTNIQLPYYINAPGGLINVDNRITIEYSYPVSGSMNLAYVSEIKATLPMLLYATFHKDYDILKKEEVLGNENAKEADYRNHLMLEEANQNATYVGFQKAGEYVAITNRKLYVTYIDSNSQTELKIGDQILKIDSYSIESKEDMYTALSTYKVGDTVSITVLRDQKEMETKSTFIEYDDRSMIGIVLGELKELDTNLDISFQFKASESGPSGGFMMALAIYNYLTEEDITKGKKIVGTGTIDSNGNVGSIGGVVYKMKGAIKNKADVFFVPEENYVEALKTKEEENLDILLIKVSTIDDAIDYLKNN